MRKLLAIGLATAPILVATAAAAQQPGVNPQAKTEAKKLTQAPGGSQTSLPETAPAATPTQATTSTQQPPLAKEANQQGKARIEKEGK